MRRLYTGGIYTNTHTIIQIHNHGLLIRWFLKVSIDVIPLMWLGRLFNRLQTCICGNLLVSVLANGTSTLFTSDLVIIVDDAVVVGEVMSISGIQVWL